MADTAQFLLELREQLLSQDNRITAHPVFIVQEKRRIWGLNPEYAEDIAWVDEECEVAPDLAKSLEAGWREKGLIPDGYIRVGYKDIWEFATACLTERGAEDYIERNKHNLRDPRVYVTSGYKNEEWMNLRAFFMAES